MSSRIVIPNGERMAFMFIANGEPTQRAVTNTDSGGNSGRMAAQIQGKNLIVQRTDTNMQL